MESKDREKLKVLLEYWVAHNREHIAENRKWRDRAADGGLEDVARRLEKVLELSEEVNHQMEHALESVASSGESGREREHGRERGHHTHGHGLRASAGRLHAHGRAREHGQAVPHLHIELHQIGTIRTPYLERVHDDFHETAGRIELHRGDRPDGEEFRIEFDERYKDGLLELETLAYVYVLFHFDRSERGAPLIVTPRHGGGARVGVFASRSPDRPNPVGLSVVRILGVEGSTVRISPIDALDGTPLLDVKPYFASDDSRPDAGEGWRKDVKE